MTPVEFFREMCLRSHRPDLDLREEVVLISDQAQVCSFDHWLHSGVPCVEPLSENPCLKIGPLPMEVTLLDGTPSTAVVVSMGTADKLMQAARLISSFNGEVV